MSGTLGMVVPEISKNPQEMCLVFVYVFTPLSEISQFPAKLLKSRKTTQIEQNLGPRNPPPKNPKAERQPDTPKTQNPEPPQPNELNVTYKLGFFSPGFFTRLRRHFRLKSRSQIADSKSRKAEWQF
jgi:hypothetical protein